LITFANSISVLSWHFEFKTILSNAYVLDT